MNKFYLIFIALFVWIARLESMQVKIKETEAPAVRSIQSDNDILNLGNDSEAVLTRLVALEESIRGADSKKRQLEEKIDMLLHLLKTKDDLKKSSIENDARDALLRAKMFDRNNNSCVNENRLPPHYVEPALILLIAASCGHTFFKICRSFR